MDYIIRHVGRAETVGGVGPLGRRIFPEVNLRLSV